MTGIRFFLFAWLVLSSTLALAIDKKYYAGYVYMFERSEQYESVMGGTVTYLRPSGHDEFEPPPDAILIEGVLSRETLAHVQRILANGTSRVVHLDSPGGDLDVGIELGRLFHERKSTAVVSRRAQCKSACALAFLGASTRLLLGEPGALGFHRQYRLVRGQVTYANFAEDRSVIAAYLKSIGSRGITADEIAATTGEATFSEGNLKDRGLVTFTREELRSDFKSMLSFSGVTAFEELSVVCSWYDYDDPSRAPREIFGLAIKCSDRVPALREPLLSAAGISVSPSVREYLLSSGDAYKVLRATDISVINAFNRANESEPGAYQRRLDLRQKVRDHYMTSSGTR